LQAVHVVDLPRPRDRDSAAFERQKKALRRALAQAAAAPGGAPSIALAVVTAVGD
jgi:hypothetical protein